MERHSLRHLEEVIYIHMNETPSPSSTHKSAPAWIGAMPPVFVLLWSTGFIGARWGLPYAEPFTFLAVRFAIAAALFALIAIASGAQWPKSFREFRDAAIVGILLNGTYLTGVFWAIDHGTPTAIAAIVVGIQPLLTAALAIPILGERLNAVQWGGLLLGFAGLLMVVWTGTDAGPLAGIIATVLSLLGITFGTFYQKRFGAGNDLRTASVIQQAAACAVVLVLSLLYETQEIEWSGDFIFALSWLVLVLSIGTFSLYYVLIRWGAVSKISSLFYLVPPVVAIDAWLFFDEILSLRQIAGMVLTAAGVALVTRTKTPK